MKTEFEREEDARDYQLSDRAGADVMRRAKKMAREFGESFVVFVGSLAVPQTACRAYQDKEEAMEAARYERSLHAGFRSAPKVHLKRIKV